MLQTYVLKFNRFLSDQNSKRSKPQYKGSIAVYHSKEAGHTYRD